MGAHLKLIGEHIFPHLNKNISPFTPLASALISSFNTIETNQQEWPTTFIFIDIVKKDNTKLY